MGSKEGKGGLKQKKKVRSKEVREGQNSGSGKTVKVVGKRDRQKAQTCPCQHGENFCLGSMKKSDSRPGEKETKCRGVESWV